MWEDNGAKCGLGLDEDTALSCMEGACQVIGNGGVWAVDMSDAMFIETNGFWNCGGAITHYLTPGDSLILSSCMTCRTCHDFYNMH